MKKGVSRSRIDSSAKIDLQYYDYQKMSAGDKKWLKFAKLIEQDPSSKMVLFSVPKGFDFANLNCNLKKRIAKAEKKDGNIITNENGLAVEI